MHLRLNASTTPRIRTEIQASAEPMTVLAKRFGASVSTMARWKKRTSVEDASHAPHRLQTTLTPVQESIVLVLRRSLGLSLDDLLAVVREFIHPTITRAALHRMLKRHGVSARDATSVDCPLGHVSPIQAMKQWQQSRPELFNRRVSCTRHLYQPTEKSSATACYSQAGIKG